MRRPGLAALALVVAACSSACLVHSRCVSNSDCSGNEICGTDGECVLECAEGDTSLCPSGEPLCLVAENRCVECLSSEDCLGTNESCVDGMCAPGLAPDFALVDQNESSPSFGQEVSLSDQTGKVVLLFFATLG